MLLTIITFVLVLSVLVFAHELGHFVSAKIFGLKPREFGIGFPPRAFGIYKNKEGKWMKVFGGKDPEDADDTIYSVNWLPLGGFVNLGEDDITATGPDTFVGKKIWQRAVMLSAGVIMNVILAAVLLSWGFMLGIPQSTDDLSAGAQVRDRKILVSEVLPDSPASHAGIMPGDAIISVDKKTFSNPDDLQNYVDLNKGHELTYGISRQMQDMNFKITPKIMKETGKGGIGVGIIETGIVSYSWYQAIWEGARTAILLTWAILIAFYELLKNLILGHGLSADLAGPVGIASLTGQAARMGFVYVLQFASLLSINLAIINFFPFPALDGGRVLFLILEKIKGKPVKRELEAIIHNIGFAVLMLLIVAVTYRDIARMSGNFFKMLWSRIGG